MKLKEIGEEIKRRGIITEFLTPAKNGTYVCLECESGTGKKGTGMVLRIKAIGKIVNPNKKYEGKSALGVEYIKDFATTNLILREYKGKNSVYSSTFYQEYNPLIIEKILRYL